MENNDNKISIKLERHKWPDEIKKAKRQRRGILIITASIIISFSLGMILSPKKGGSIIGGNDNLSRFEAVYNELKNNWYFGREMDNVGSDLIDNAIIGMLKENGDIHTSFMSAEEAKNFSNSIDQEFVGIGVQYTGNNLNLVTRVYKDSPAEKAGILAGDIFYEVDGNPIEGLDSDEIKKLIIGDAGTKVEVTILRKNEPITFTMTRAEVSAIAFGEVLESGVAYLEISSFGRNLGSIVQAYLDDFIAQGATELVIDLRDNGGGYLQAINDLSRLFFENNDIVYSEEFTDGKETIYNVSKSEKANYPFDNIVLLQNENSASASEVLAMAMRENNNTQIVGVTSYGKGTVQTQTQFSDQSVLKLTIARWLSPHGTSIDEVGIVPDVESRLHDIFYTPYFEMEEGSKVRYDEVDGSVAYMQIAMNFLGIHHGRQDGYFDHSTLQSLQQFQTDHNLPVQDYIEQDTLKAVYSAVMGKWSLDRKENDIQLNKAIEVVLGES